ncbi:MAG: hypothetical protein LBO75_03480, partial [Bifidobacteriaceae bacterium]|nr:hypothetical protein [Bifidobacteriaceae bacterium]
MKWVKCGFPVVVGLVLLLGGCTGSASDPVSKPSGSASASVGTKGDIPFAKGFISSPVELPFYRYFEAADAAYEVVSDSPSETERMAESAEFEESVAECMKQRGFTYYPIPPEPFPELEEDYSRHKDLLIPWLPDSLAEVERVGYGITPPEEYSDEDVVLIPEVVKNEEYRSELSASAQQEYDLALLGRSYDYVEGMVDPEAEANSCTGRALASAPPEVAVDTESAWWNITEPLDAISQAMKVEYTLNEQGVPETIMGTYAVERDPKFVELEVGYAECVKSKATGWDASRVNGIRMMESIAMSTAPDGSQWEWPPEGKVVDTTDVPPEYSYLMGSQAERDIAVVDFKCRQETDYV